jgi:hypothetical protein
MLRGEFRNFPTTNKCFITRGIKIIRSDITANMGQVINIISGKKMIRTLKNLNNINRLTLC